MTAQRWRQWLLSSRGERWPSCVADLMPPEVSAACLVIHNDPSARNPLDAEGHLSMERLDALVETLGRASAGEWMIGWWDGWRRITEDLEGVFGDRVFQLGLPARGYLACHASLEELARFSHAQWPFVGPSLMAPLDRSVLVVGDVDWATTYLGFSSSTLRDRVASLLEQHGVAGNQTCDPQTPLPGFEREDAN